MRLYENAVEAAERAASSEYGRFIGSNVVRTAIRAYLRALPYGRTEENLCVEGVRAAEIASDEIGRSLGTDDIETIIMAYLRADQEREKQIRAAVASSISQFVGRHVREPVCAECVRVGASHPNTGRYIAGDGVTRLCGLCSMDDPFARRASDICAPDPVIQEIDKEMRRRASDKILTEAMEHADKCDNDDCQRCHHR